MCSQIWYKSDERQYKAAMRPSPTPAARRVDHEVGLPAQLADLRQKLFSIF
jgi:hypothetical protein